MAANNPGIQEDKFVVELNCIKEKIRDRFRNIKERVEERENKLLNEIDDIIANYQLFKNEISKKSEERQDIEALLRANKDARITSTTGNSLRENLLTQLNEQLKVLKIPTKPQMVDLKFKPDKLLTELANLGKFVETIDSIDYAKKKQPIFSECKKGNRDSQLKTPRSVAVDPSTGKIFVADQSNSCIKVFDSAAKYLCKFGDVDGEQRIRCPRHLTITGNKLFLCQGDCSILSYHLEGQFISKVGVNGTGELEFNYPWCVTTNECGSDVYVCDVNNNRIQIISEDFKYKSQFGNDILNKPRHIKVTRDNIFILDASNPCLHVFGNDSVQQTCVITTGEGERIIDPLFFFVDRFGNFLLSDHGSDSIIILNSNFKHIHKIAVSNSPMEVTMDGEDRIIVVCQADNRCLQIF